MKKFKFICVIFLVILSFVILEIFLFLDIKDITILYKKIGMLVGWNFGFVLMILLPLGSILQDIDLDRWERFIEKEAKNQKRRNNV